VERSVIRTDFPKKARTMQRCLKFVVTPFREFRVVRGKEKMSK